MNHDQLVARYPIVVRIPGPWRGFLLQWETENEGNHVIMARTARAAAETFWILDRRFDEALRAVGFWRAQLVRPPRRFEVTYAKREAEAERHAFSYWLERLVDHHAKELGIPLSLHVVRCGEHPPDSDARYDCPRCFHGISFLDRGPAETYALLRGIYLSDTARRLTPEAANSRSPLPDPKRPIYSISDSHAFRGVGVSIARATAYWTGDILFQGERLDLPRFLTKRLTQRDARLASERRQDENNRLAERQVREDAHRNRLRALAARIRTALNPFDV